MPQAKLQRVTHCAALRPLYTADFVVDTIYAKYEPRVESANLPGWCWAQILQSALVGLSSSLHTEVCNAVRLSDGLIPDPSVCFRMAEQFTAH